ncbi:MAG: Gfo/Idh/MocA family oxidoreductase [Bacteroidetes bacterium]|nr:Gfo/Idh/MocA family oxidoreductase [Bacteroidota bacterium]
MLKIGVLGAGHLGKIHIKLIQQIAEYELVGFFDSNIENAQKVSAQFGAKAYNSVDDLIEACDVVDIVTPTLSHYECAVKAIKLSKHIFIEKPLTNTVEEGEKLLNLISEAGVKGQVGHVERFNPAYLAAQKYKLEPSFMEIHRLAEFNPRGTDVPVVLDLMIHDIDIVLHLIKANVKHISASGVAVVSDTPDIANARIEFDNGAVANLTASRISLKKMRKARMFQRDAYITIDYLEKKVEAVKIGSEQEHTSPFTLEWNPGDGKPTKQLSFESPAVPEVNAIKYELELFAKAINEDLVPEVTIEDGYRSLEVAHMILDKIEMTHGKLQAS